MKRSLYLRRGTTALGPFTFAKLQEDVQAGSLFESDLLSESETGPWAEASQIDGLSFPTKGDSTENDGENTECSDDVHVPFSFPLEHPDVKDVNKKQELTTKPTSPKALTSKTLEVEQSAVEKAVTTPDDSFADSFGAVFVIAMIFIFGMCLLVFVTRPFRGHPDITPVDIPTSIDMALSGRAEGMKKTLLGTYGGTETTESAVIRGLEWLKRNQNRDGMWSLSGNYSLGAPTENRAAATAMALLAFQGHGSTHKSGPYQSVVARGWNALIKKQDAEGNFFFTGGHHHRLYTHAQATIALCELYGMTKDETLKAPAQKALSYCFASQSPQGGWRYSPGGASDTSVTGWFVMALQSGRMAGLTVPVVNLDRISAYLDTATTDAGIRYAYIPGQSDTLSMTAEGLLCRQYLGWKQSDPRLVQGLDYLVNNPIRFADMDVYYWYYCTQAMHHMGGAHWTQWNSVMRQSIPEEQIKTGNERGSWEPSRDRHGHLGGRLYTTCLCIYMLEVYYRHLPIYKH